MPRSILHVDMDAFFASVEQVLRPELSGRPVIVAGAAEARGVVSAASYEARRYGVRSAMPTAQARKLCPQGVFLPGNHRAYEEFSCRVFSVLRTFTPLVEPTSIDEAYLDVTGCTGLFGEPVSLARRIKDRVRDETGLTSSVGVAPNRLLAKTASEWEKPDGLMVLTAEDVPHLLWPRPVGELHGVGPSTAATLRSLGLLTVGDLASYPLDLAVRHLGTAGRHLRDAANGVDDTPVAGGGHQGETKSLSHETTFARDVSEPAELEKTLLALSEQVARRLRREGLTGRTVTLRIRRADFATATRATTLPEPTDLTEVIYAAAGRALSAYWQPSMRIRLLGVGVSKLESAASSPEGLFDSSSKLRRASKAVDGIRDKYGEKAVIRARLLPRKEPQP